MLNSGFHDNNESLEKGHYVVLHSRTNKQTNSVVQLVVWGFHWDTLLSFVQTMFHGVKVFVNVRAFLNIMAKLNISRYAVMQK